MEQRPFYGTAGDLFALAYIIEKRIRAASIRAGSLIESVLAKAFRGELVATEADLARQLRYDYGAAAQGLPK